MARISGGLDKGRHLVNAKNSRPTTGRAREALFSILQIELPSSVFFDAFAGGGSIGLEALSRGATVAHFSEISHRAIKAIEENLTRVGFHHVERDCWKNEQMQTAYVHTGDFFRTRQKEIPGEPVEILFLDPPWDMIEPKMMMSEVAEITWLSENSWIILEHPKRISTLFPKSDGKLVQTDQRWYGDTAFTFWRTGN